jgi:hypothetical protein
MATQQPAPRLSLAHSTDQRDETANKFDARVVNGFVEKTENGLVVVKRPAISTYITLTGGGPVQGCYWWNGSLYAITAGNIYKDGVLLSAITTAGGSYSFASVLGATPKMVFHNSSNMYYTDGTTVTFSAAGSSAVNIQGFAYLDGTLYGGNSPFNIRGSALNDPATWDALNVITAQKEPDNMVAVYKQLQYVVVFKWWTIEAFWDAGNPTGSPLQSAPGTLLPFGCRQPGSIQQFEDLLVFASATRNGSVGIMYLENLRPTTISTPAIERLLQDADWSLVYSWCGRLGGHRFYCITLVNSNISLVYDFTTRMWFQWTYGPNQTYLPFMFCTSLPNRQIVLQHENGSLYTLSNVVYNDDGQEIVVDIYTQNWDGGTRNRKTLKRMELIADQALLKNVKVRWSEDDYQSWSNFREFNASKKRPYLDDLGTFYRRAFNLRYNAYNAPLRVEALEMTNVMEGSA